MRHRPIIAWLVTMTATASLFMLASPASADPVNPPKAGLIVTISCEGKLGSPTVIQEGLGNWTQAAIPMHVIDSNQVITAYAVRFEVVVGDTTEVVQGSKPAPRNGRTDICHLHLDGFDATWWVTYTPA